jgi:hypothetical protein
VTLAAVGSHPVNLALRFLLELAGLAALGVWGWQVQGVLAAAGAPLVAAAAWGVFNVPEDPSRSGQAPVRVPGLVRLALELAFFTGAVFALHGVAPRLALAFAAIVVVHYAASYDRVAWLLRS